MDEKELRRLLRAKEHTRDEPDRLCPGEKEIAAYVEHRLRAKDEARIELHLADCDDCLEQVTLLLQEPATAPGPVAPDALVRARNLVVDGQAGWRASAWRWAAVAATAACIVLAVALQLRAPGVGPTVSAPRTAAPPCPGGAPPSVPATAPSAPSATTAPAPVIAVPPAARLRTAPPPETAVRKSVGKPLDARASVSR